MSARPGLCGGHRATGVPTAIGSYDRTMRIVGTAVAIGLATLDLTESGYMRVHRL